MNLRILAKALVVAALPSVIYAQAPRQLQVDVGPNQQVWILASDVSYGEALRALQAKLGWEIEIPPLADELKISYIRVEPKRPQDALATLLEGSRLGYAFLGGVNGPRIVKVVVTPTTSDEVGITQDPVSGAPISDNAKAGPALPLPAQPAASIQPHTAVGAAQERPGAPSTMPLSEAINAIGVPPGVSPADVGRMKTFSISDAATVMGVPPGVSPADVGRKTTFSISDAATVMGVPPGVSPADVGRVTVVPISDAAKIMGVPPGTSPDNVGKTITLPLPTAPAKRP